MAELTQTEIDERIAILKRYKNLLEQQRTKFREYLKVLEHQQDSINKASPDELFAHTALEEQIMQNIVSLQKVIVPMNELYNQANKKAGNIGADKDISEIQADLNHLQEKVLAQNTKNRQLLRTNLGILRQQLNNLKNPYAYSHSVYAQKQAVASLVEIQA